MILRFEATLGRRGVWKNGPKPWAWRSALSLCIRFWTSLARWAIPADENGWPRIHVGLARRPAWY